MAVEVAGDTGPIDTDCALLPEAERQAVFRPKTPKGTYLDRS